MPSSKHKDSGGSSACGPATQYRIIIRKYTNLLLEDKSSGKFLDMWNNRNVQTPMDSYYLDYISGGGEAQDHEGFYFYYRRLVGSTRNTSTISAGGLLGLPDVIWTDFSADAKGMASTADAVIGKKCWQMITDHPDKYSDGVGMELMCAWLGAATTIVVSS